MGIPNADRIVDFLDFYVLLKDSFLQEEPQHILMSVLIQDGE